MASLVETFEIGGNGMNDPCCDTYAAAESTRLPVVPQGKLAMSLFSGAGGLDLGVEAAGFRTLACIEIDENCCATLTANQPEFLAEAKIVNSSVVDVDVEALMKDLGLKAGQLDLLFGGPPCQTFSQIGKKGSTGDARGQLLFSMVDYARVLRPKAVLIENVKALRSAVSADGRKGGVLEDLEGFLSQLGYAVSYQVLNSADFGVPQKRERLILVALRGAEKFAFPEPTHTPQTYSTVGGALSKLPKPSPKGSKPKFANHVDVTPLGDQNRISYVPEGKYLAKVKDAPADVKGRLSKKDTTKFLRLGRGKQSNTLRCGEIFFHPLQDRYLTPREYMRLHGFPDDYELRGPIRGRSGSVRNLDQHRQVANSVPPPLAKAIAAAVREQLENASNGGPT